MMLFKNPGLSISFRLYSGQEEWAAFYRRVVAKAPDVDMSEYDAKTAPDETNSLGLAVFNMMWARSEDDYRLVLHEMTHSVIRTLRALSLLTSLDEDELIARTLDWLFGSFLRRRGVVSGAGRVVKKMGKH